MEEKYEKIVAHSQKLSPRSCQAQFKLCKVNNVDLGLQFQILPFFHFIFMTSDRLVLVNSVLTQTYKQSPWGYGIYIVSGLSGSCPFLHIFLLIS